MTCPICGVRAETDASYCPRCGTGLATSIRPKRRLARLSLTLGVLAVPGVCFLPGACLCVASGGMRPESLFPMLDWFALSRVVPFLARLSVLVASAAVLLGVYALWQIRSRPGVYRGRHLAIDGIVSGSVMLVCSLILVAELGSRRDSILKTWEIHIAQQVLRTFLWAEEGYSGANGGQFDTPECVARPCRCLPRCDQPALTYWSGRLEPLPLTAVAGYSFQFYPGPPSSGIDPARFSSSSLSGFAAVATPLDERLNLRTFCVDARGVLCVIGRGESAAVVGGRCPASCVALE